MTDPVQEPPDVMATPPTSPPIVRVKGLCKTFPKSARPALDRVSFDVERGEMVALLGASGSGKSTLIRLLLGLDAADSGVALIMGREVQKSGRAIPPTRSAEFGPAAIFQQFNLVGRLSVLTNVLIGLLGDIPRWRTYLGAFTIDEKRAAMRALDRVGLASFAERRTSTLSGGQQQRVAIARSVLRGAPVLLADEPIASLDPESADRVMSILRTINQEDGATVIVALHQVAFARAYCTRTIGLKSARVVYDGSTDALHPALLSKLYQTSGGQPGESHDEEAAFITNHAASLPDSLHARGVSV